MNYTRQEQPKVCPCVDPVLVLFVNGVADNFEHSAHTDAQTCKDYSPIIPKDLRHGECMNCRHCALFFQTIIVT